MRLLGAVAAVLLLAGCTSSSPSEEATKSERVVTPASHVDVDTAELRAQKEQAGIAGCRPGEAPLASPRALPKIVLPCLGGGSEVNLNELRGPLVINLWAQWCKPCRDELPYYQRLHEEAPGGVRVLGIDYLDPQPAGALELAEDTGVTFPLLADPSGALREEFRIRGLPGVVFVDESGDMTTELPTFTVIDSYAELRSLLEQQLGIEK